jgi:general L-amino acid transport system permease protein
MRARGWSVARIRATLWQFAAICLVCALLFWLTSNTLDNLASRGISSGFGFLGTSAGFGITMSLIDYSEASSFGRAFFVGLLNTLLVSAIAIVLATLIGFMIGVSRLSANWLVSRLAGVYVETLRNIPLLLQIFFWYFAVLRTLPGPRASLDTGGVFFLNNRGLYMPSVQWGGVPGWVWLIAIACCGAIILRGAVSGEWSRRRRFMLGGSFFVVVILTLAAATADIQTPSLRGFNFVGGTVIIPEFMALLIALSTYTAAYIAEIVRAGIQSVPAGQVEAAQALGLSRRDAMRSVIVPQALRLIIPPLTNQYLNLTKNSSLAAAIAYPDLVSVFAGTVLNITGQAVEVIAITMAVYLVISLTIAAFMNFYNRTVALKGVAG